MKSIFAIFLVFLITIQANVEIQQNSNGLLRIKTRAKRNHANFKFQSYMEKVSSKLDKIEDNYKFDIRQVMSVINQNERKIKRLDSILKTLVAELNSAEIACKANPCGKFGICKPIISRMNFRRMNFSKFVCNCLRGYSGEFCENKA